MKIDETNGNFRILSIDGGGVRGAFPAGYLDYVQNQIGDTHISNFFDLIVGTSTGGIIALALGLQMPTSRIVDLYKRSSSAIFRRRLLRFGLIRSKYPNIPLLNELKGTSNISCSSMSSRMKVHTRLNLTFHSTRSAGFEPPVQSAFLL